MSKKKKQQMPLDVAKAVWEEYANIRLEMFTKKLGEAVAVKDWIAVRLIGGEMEQFKFDFNRGNK